MTPSWTGPARPRRASATVGAVDQSAAGSHWVSWCRSACHQAVTYTTICHQLYRISGSIAAASSIAERPARRPEITRSGTISAGTSAHHQFTRTGPVEPSVHPQAATNARTVTALKATNAVRAR